jgi:NAD(P)H-hydrate epimerase
MARLLKTTIGRVQENRIETARQWAEGSGCFSVLKGFQTVVATPTGQVFINNTGNPGMATAGSGDILAGILARFVAGWSRRFHGADLAALADHVSAAVYLHGLAGDGAANQQGVESMIATDLLTYLPAAFRKVASG